MSSVCFASADSSRLTLAGPFQPVEFENLTVTPYVGSNGRLAFSYRATALVAPKTLAEVRGKAA